MRRLLLASNNPDKAREFSEILAGLPLEVVTPAALGLRLEVVDGALAASRLFGGAVGGGIQAVDVALRPLFTGVAYVVFYAGLAFGVLACADFAPTLLAPGRIEHLLSLPVRRAELVVGTFLGVLALVGSLWWGM